MTVVAAFIERDSRVLICQRRRDDVFPLKWEFPGGKVHAGESPAQALARELAEELELRVTIGRELFRTRHRYAEHPGDIELIFFAVSVGDAAVGNLAFEQIVWEEPARLAAYDFLAADREFIALLAAGRLRL